MPHANIGRTARIEQSQPPLDRGNRMKIGLNSGNTGNLIVLVRVELRDDSFQRLLSRTVLQRERITAKHTSLRRRRQQQQPDEIPEREPQAERDHSRNCREMPRQQRGETRPEGIPEQSQQ